MTASYLGCRVGLLGLTVQVLKSLFGNPTALPFNSICYINWVNTRIQDGLLVEVVEREGEPFYLSEVYLTIQDTTDDRELNESHEEMTRMAYQELLHRMGLGARDPERIELELN